MAQITFYPLGNADCCLIQTDGDQLVVFDYAAKRNVNDDTDKRIDLPDAFRSDMGWPDRKEVDVLAITHGDDDHVKGISDIFYLEHASKYQGENRIKIKELWVPAAMVVEEGSEDEARILRQEARHRLLKGSGVRVFSRPSHLKDWLEKNGLTLESRRDMITDAGQLVPGWSLDSQGIEFFVHSPFGHRQGDGTVIDRNDNCLVMQSVIRSSGTDTRFLITADSTADAWQAMVTITRAHKNDQRLSWDVFKLPHHCSYLSMAAEKGVKKTVPTPEFEWLLSQGARYSVMVSTSDIIPDDNSTQPPHIQTYRRYKEAADSLDAELKVTMEHPSKANPDRIRIKVDNLGATLEKTAVTAGVTISSNRSPRMG